MTNNDLALVVDDDLFTNKVICTQLSKIGFTNLEGFTDPLKALDFLRQNVDRIGLIVCDLQMPTLDGIEFVREVAHEGYTGKVILISGEDPRLLRSAQRLVEAMGLSTLGAIQKPVQLDTLKSIFDTAFSERKPYTSHVFDINEVKQAIANNELVNYYQPKVDLVTGVVVGVEALIRWIHPEHGVVSPASFLPAIEKAGFDDLLLMHVLSGSTGALPLLRDIASREPDFKVAVNISDANLADARMPEKLLALVQSYGVATRNLVLEISENRATGSRTKYNSTLSRLALKGFSLSLDDFGAGKTTMNDLSDIAISEIKFDRDFVHNVHRDAAQKMSLRSCIKMAEALDLITVAEGVEEIEDWEVLRDLGCNIVQGYIVAKPMPIDALDSWLVQWAQNRKELFSDSLSKNTEQVDSQVI
jgi:EAL domain-containing protein (putative c-di-GMP-specific phosphodiesterase class I)/FixJ family two-component response regulator